MKKKTSACFIALVALASCAHETAAHKPVGEEKLELSPDPPEVDAGAVASTDDDPDPDSASDVSFDAGVVPVVYPPNVFADGTRAVLSDPKVPGFWQVSMEVAKSANALLPAYVREHRPKIAPKLDRYFAQIYGGMSSKGRHVVVFYMINRDATRIGDDGSQNSDDWMVHATFPKDGADLFFPIYFDADSGRFP